MLVIPNNRMRWTFWLKREGIADSYGYGFFHGGTGISGIAVVRERRL